MGWDLFVPWSEDWRGLVKGGPLMESRNQKTAVTERAQPGPFAVYTQPQRDGGLVAGPSIHPLSHTLTLPSTHSPFSLSIPLSTYPPTLPIDPSNSALTHLSTHPSSFPSSGPVLSWAGLLSCLSDLLPPPTRPGSQVDWCCLVSAPSSWISSRPATTPVSLSASQP